MKLAEISAFAPPGAETKAYSLEEIVAMLKVFPEPSATVVATDAFTGLRLGELRGLTWQSNEPAQDEESLGWLSVTRSVWHSVVGEPKTAKSKAPVSVIPQLAQGWTDIATDVGVRRMGQSSQTQLRIRST